MKETDTVIDIEEGIGDDVSLKVTVNELASANGENPASLSGNTKCVGGGVLSSTEEKRKSMSGKKPPKPPRPPRGLSLDAADQRLIKELSELAMIKRARIERVKALKKMKAAKASSSSSSSSAGNLVAMLFTILFCLVIVFRGCHFPGILLRNNLAAVIPAPPKFNGETEGKIVMVGEEWNSLINSMPLSEVRSPNVTKLFPDSDKDEKRQDTH